MGRAYSCWMLNLLVHHVTSRLEKVNAGFRGFVRKRSHCHITQCQSLGVGESREASRRGKLIFVTLVPIWLTVISLADPQTAVNIYVAYNNLTSVFRDKKLHLQGFAYSGQMFNNLECSMWYTSNMVAERKASTPLITKITIQNDPEPALRDFRVKILCAPLDLHTSYDARAYLQNFAYIYITIFT